VVPERVVRGLQNEADPLPKVRQAMEKPSPDAAKTVEKTASLRLPIPTPAPGREVA